MNKEETRQRLIVVRMKGLRRNWQDVGPKKIGGRLSETGLKLERWGKKTEDCDFNENINRVTGVLKDTSAH